MFTGFRPGRQRNISGSTRGRGVGAFLALAMVLAAMFAVAPQACCSTEVAKDVPADVPADWWSAVQRDITQSEYHITPGGGPTAAEPTASYQAPNRTQNFRTYFADDGIRVIPRTNNRDEAPAWEWRLVLSGLGRDEAPAKPAGPPRLTVNGNRIEYQWDGLTEWYVNDARGLEQGFTIHQRPRGASSTAATSPLRVELAVGGSLKATLTDDGAAVDFMTSENARAIRFDHLEVIDANRHALPARFERRADDDGGEWLAIVVDDTEATYPITIDPLATSPSWTTSGAQANAELGISVATAGDVNGDGFSDVIVGAYHYDNGETDEGRAYVFHGSAGGLNSSPGWTAERNQAGAGFGISVSTAGDVNGDGFSDVIVGAYLYGSGQPNEGHAFLYHGSAAGLNPTPNTIAQSNQAGAQFGWTVATAGDVNGDGFSDVIIGAPFFDNGQANEGRAYCFYGSAGGLTITNWTAEGNVTDARFGWSAASTGDVNGDGFDDVIVGAPFYTNLLTHQGQAIVYLGSAGGLGGFNWVVTGAQAYMYYGIQAATAGDVNGDGYSDVIVNAYLYDNGENDEGRVFVYHGSATGLPLIGSNWSVEGDQVGANFGWSVATAGDVNGDGFSDVIVGAPYFDNGQTDEGRVFVYHGSTGGLGVNPTWTAESDQANAWFGNSVATAGDVNGDGFSDVIVGAQLFEHHETNEGRAMVYLGAAAGLGTNPNWSAKGDQSSAHLGWSVATAGDVNGDGFSDVVVGAPLFDNNQTNEGRALVFYGSAAGPSLTANWTAESDQADAEFGTSVATAGDVNGDGFSDVIVGAFRYNIGVSDEGRVYVYYGSAMGLSPTANWIGANNQTGSWFGLSVATAGDVNADGFSDVIVGAPIFTYGPPNLRGRAYVYLGSSGGLGLGPVWTTEGTQQDLRFGSSVASAGDVNGDGFSDVIVGAPFFDNGQTDEGRAYVYHGSAAGPSLTANWTAESDQVGAKFGTSVATAGDVNGDGFSDVIVGAPYLDNGHTDEGRAYVYRGSITGLSPTANWTAESDQADAEFGTSVAMAGDVNGNGFSDVIVGAPSFYNGLSSAGRAFMYHGSAAGLHLAPDWTADGELAGASFGYSVSTAGDVNGDGFGDVIVGDHNSNNGQPVEGRAFVFYGNGGGGFPYLPRQSRTDESAPISLLGTSDSETAFQLKATGHTAAGQGTLSLQFEVKPAGVPFDGTGLVTGPATNPAPGNARPPSGEVLGGDVPLSALASGLTPGTLYHWRLRIISDSPFFPRTRWLSPAGNSPSEADVRTAGAVSGVDDVTVNPFTPVRLAPGSPNPFGSATNISFTLPQRGPHRLAVYDINGREVKVLASGVGEAGSHQLRWDGRDERGALPSGVYFLRLEYADQVESRKVMIVR